MFCTDITYLPFKDRFAYLSVIKDIASGEAVAWNISARPDIALVMETVKKIKPNLATNPLIHSDQGFHYTNPNYIKIIQRIGMTQPMSGKGGCIDNAQLNHSSGT